MYRILLCTRHHSRTTFSEVTTLASHIEVVEVPVHEPNILRQWCRLQNVDEFVRARDNVTEFTDACLKSGAQPSRQTFE